MKVYAVLLASPVTGTCRYVFPSLPVIVPAEPAASVVGDWAVLLMYGVMVYDVTGPDPGLDGARKLTVAPASFVTLVTFVGAPGGLPAGGDVPPTVRLGLSAYHPGIAPGYSATLT